MKLLQVLLQPRQRSELQECKQMHAHADTPLLPLHTRTHMHTCSLSLCQ